MDLRQLQALVAVADHGSFTAAADALATVQSNVSAHIARLEKELGVVLVHRAGGRLTEEGETVVERARRIEAELDALVADVTSLGHEVTGRVRLGVIGTTARWLAPRILEAMSEHHPAVQVVMVDATSTSLEPQLANGRLDLAVINLPVENPDLITEPLFSEDLLLFVPTGHPFAERSELDLDDLEELRLLLPPPGTSFRDVLDDAAAAIGVSLRPHAELDGLRLIASLAIAGYAPAILPASAVPEHLRGNSRPVSVHGLPHRHVGLARRRRGLPSAPSRAMLEMLRTLGASSTDLPGIHPHEP